MSDKPKFPRADALAVAKELCIALKPCTLRLIVAGSLRRMKAEVGDVEILFVDKVGSVKMPGEMLPQAGWEAEATIAHLLHRGVLDYRLTTKGAKVYGPKNKLLTHVASGIPVDLFTATLRNWWNYLVCRTGGADHNVKIAQRAQELGYKWHPYGAGLTRNRDGAVTEITSEQHLFQFLNLPYLEPSERS